MLRNSIMGVYNTVIPQDKNIRHMKFGNEL